jgi:hypothetical protein
MKRLGELLMWLGAGVGTSVALAMMIHLKIGDFPWALTVALAKSALVGAGGLMTAGAFARRMGVRADARRLDAERHPAALDDPLR